MRQEFRFRPVQARWIRLQIQSATGGEARIDELEIYGQKEPIPVEKIGPPPSQLASESTAEETELLRYAFLSEEHAWLKTFGRADLGPSLAPYNGRVKEYPRYVGDDRLSRDEIHAIQCWIDMNCPLWPDYVQRELRPGPSTAATERQ